MKKEALVWGLALSVALVVSRLTVFDPMWHGMVAVCIAVFVVILASLCPTQALAVLAAELIIGSKGRLFVLLGDGVQDGGVSVRVLMFAAFLVGYAVWTLRTRSFPTREMFKSWRPWLILAGSVALSVLLGALRHQPFLVSDANAWGFLLLVVPVTHLATIKRDELWRALRPALFASLLVLGLVTLASFVCFAREACVHGDAWYLWIRRSGLGEITTLFEGYGVARVFLQSHIYASLALIGLVALSIKSIPRHWRILSILIAATVLISLSRSLWLGLAAGLIVAIASGFRLQVSGMIKQAFFPFMFGAILVAIPFYLPTPLGVSPFDLLKARAEVSDAAGMSRWQMLTPLWEKIRERPLLGHGFGATVTFRSSDPRIVEKTGGVTTAFAFEWGWLDLWIKGGIVLVLAMLGLLGWLWREARTLDQEQKWLVRSTVIALIVTHTFTPYLSHPLGLAVLIALMVLVVSKSADVSS